MDFIEFEADICGWSIDNAAAKKQLNVWGAGKDAGTELITYDFAEASNSQFFLKLV